MKPFLSIIIPCYNESQFLPLTLLDVDKYLSTVNFSYEIIVVDAQSIDNTIDIVKKMQKMIKNLNLELSPWPEKKGGAVKYGMLKAKGQWRLFIDAKNIVFIDQFENMIPYFKQGYDIIVGSRFAQKFNFLQFYKFLFVKIINLLIKLFLALNINDGLCQFKCFSEQAAQTLFTINKINNSMFNIEIIALAKSLGYKMKEVPIQFSNTNHKYYKFKFKNLLINFLSVIKIKYWLMTKKYAA
ncbi:MAG: glycosyltransferase [Minisyncoccia bacterium]